MTEKPLVILLQGNAKIGKQVLNFDRYQLSINYRMSSQGITIELSPPQKKKMVNYNKKISPYDPPPICSRCCFARKKSENKSHMNAGPGVKEKCYRQHIFNKLRIQHVFNFSETPINLLENSKPKSTHQLFAKCERFAKSEVNEISSNTVHMFKSDIKKTKSFKNKNKSVKKSKSQPVQKHSRTSYTIKSARACKSCVVILKSKVEKLQKENLSLRKRLQLIRNI